MSASDRLNFENVGTARRSILIVAALSISACQDDAAKVPPGADPPEVALGERLFHETRFTQYFATHSGGDVNAVLPAGDPVMDAVVTLANPLSGPFAGQSMNCAQCHLVDQLDGVAGAGIRTYGDFARRSPIPDRGDGQTTTPRNSPPLVNASLARSAPFLLHFDGEFATSEDLVLAAWTGRNFGWLADEGDEARAQIVAVIRGDDGTDAIAEEFGGLSYAEVLGGGAKVPPEFALPGELRLDVATATDAQILDVVSRLVTAYMDQLEFARDENGDFNGSPYDRFLAKNGLPRHPFARESERDYDRRLRARLAELKNPRFVTTDDGAFVHHDHPFAFGPTELEGLRIFLAGPASTHLSPAEIATGHIGNCASCHSGPEFTDFLVHNTGAAQAEFDAVHGAGSFVALAIPDLAARRANPAAYLPATAAHPTATGVFRSVPHAANPSATDLGTWNIFANDDFPHPQIALRHALEAVHGDHAAERDDAGILEVAIGTFKTPGLRDLGHGAPYLHTGQADTLDAVVAHYQTVSAQARAGQLRSGDPRIADVALTEADVAPLVAFLRALDEDYE